MTEADRKREAWVISDKQEYSNQPGSVLEGPNGQEFWLTEPEDRSWYRDLKKVVLKLNEYESQLTAANAETDKQCELLSQNNDYYDKKLTAANAKVEKLREAAQKAVAHANGYDIDGTKRFHFNHEKQEEMVFRNWTLIINRLQQALSDTKEDKR